MAGQTINFEAPDGTAEAYLVPGPDGPHAGVLLLIDAIGLRPQIELMADRIAAWGYTVFAPNVFYRAGTAAELAPQADLREPGAREAFFGTMGSRRTGMETPNLLRDLAGCLDQLAAQPGVDGARIGATGYCMGGMLALRAAAAHPDRIRAAGAFHAGNLVTDEPDSVHRVITTATAEVLAGHADNDRSNPPEAIAALDEAMRSAGITFTTAVYPGAQHGYTMADTSSYDEAGAERHFRELQDLFARTLGS
ncbi:dienelactone hydrolase family protein [Microlunatus speluncae]|uniref:dienelactone hydrolase family protein n=1 Tax=Microlunatus speluncae TaxID=2594267 RepID=UPI0012663F24|nr:dienelactone hydrolase family protein [Microlunatus speluncae]